LFPLADINPQSFVNIYEADETIFYQSNSIKIYHDAEHASKISILRFKRVTATVDVVLIYEERQIKKNYLVK
jgi:hypothetical protein